MLKHFIKYQSLGNDFILYDWYKKPAVFVQNALMDSGWPQFVTELCNRHLGVGADGVLIIKSSVETSFPEMLIFNSDGSQAHMCMNGVRSAAHYLFTHHGVQKIFKIRVGQRDIECSIIEDKSRVKSIDIVTNVGGCLYQEKIAIGGFEGHSVSVGNQHLVIFQHVEQTWLAEHGKEFSEHKNFPDRTNVEFVVEDFSQKLQNCICRVYNILVYERGCGITLACSSGVAATLGTLFYLGMVKQDELIAFNMLGGTVCGHVDCDQNIVLRATATMVFSGVLEHKE